MKIAVIGAAGKAGSRITEEAQNRGHQVTAIVRHPENLKDPSIPYIKKDLFDLTRDDLTAFDVVVNAFATPPDKGELYIKAERQLSHLLENAPGTRLIIVGGAGSLFVDDEKKIRLIDTPDFPEAFKSVAVPMTASLEELQASENLNWTFLSPSAIFALGQRTGHYKTGKDNLLVNSDGKSYVSYEDYAAALVDEIEQPKHVNGRFTVVSEEN
ncbi:NAD(P)-dependent oxidoreductase [Sporolactobacillus sp. CPB3-1]|uniref:NAD(P)-dependent oxidoreductase n=1 Tax=Sporolactobacillus mangiferae TaxID=2940498 RepID=A0ABT0MBT1_9BACL|nr:NAD(P)-dependent oxidoreductase [Sporolactobacillus mangiferae]MCL1632321.1 NAD(P)-dependent oxidoreductase [Sporolactobacillus mangiferae]